jgi:anti-sigma regulatory factor (Ser/Thr protein kinase)
MDAWESAQDRGEGRVAPPRTSADAGPGPGAGPGSFSRMATVVMPADKDYLALARTSAMQIAALLDLPLSRVTDLRLAVDEACSSFLVGPAGDGEPAPGADSLELRYDRFPAQLHVTVRGTASSRWPTRDELGWEMLRALVGEVRAEVVDGVGVLTLIEPLPGAG